MNAETLTPELASLGRQVITGLGIFGVTWAQGVSGSQIEFWAGIAATAASALWGVWQKRKAKAALAAAQASAYTSAIPPKLPA